MSSRAFKENIFGIIPLLAFLCLSLHCQQIIIILPSFCDSYFFKDNSRVILQNSE